MNPSTKELVGAVESVLGFVWGENIESRRERDELPPIVPEIFRQVAAEEVFSRLERALIAFKELESIREKRLEPMVE